MAEILGDEVKSAAVDTATVSRAAAMVAAHLHERQPRMTDILLFKTELLAPLYTMLEHEQRYPPASATGDAAVGNGVDREAAAGEEQVDTCLRKLHLLGQFAPPGSRLFAAAARPVLAPLFRLFCVASAGKSYLRTKTQDILLLYFRVRPRQGTSTAVSFTHPPSTPPHSSSSSHRWWRHRRPRQTCAHYC